MSIESKPLCCERRYVIAEHRLDGTQTLAENKSLQRTIDLALQEVGRVGGGCGGSGCA
jgi:hypothetical protein